MSSFTLLTEGRFLLAGELHCCLENWIFGNALFLWRLGSTGVVYEKQSKYNK